MFENKNISVLTYADGRTIFQYKDRKLDYSKVDSKTFFNRLSKYCEVGDKICVAVKDFYAELIVVKVDGKSTICKELIKVSLEVEDD